MCQSQILTMATSSASQVTQMSYISQIRVRTIAIAIAFLLISFLFLLFSSLSNSQLLIFFILKVICFTCSAPSDILVNYNMLCLSFFLSLIHHLILISHSYLFMYYYFSPSYFICLLFATSYLPQLQSNIHICSQRLLSKCAQVNSQMYSQLHGQLCCAMCCQVDRRIIPPSLLLSLTFLFLFLLQ